MQTRSILDPSLIDRDSSNMSTYVYVSIYYGCLENDQGAIADRLRRVSLKPITGNIERSVLCFLRLLQMPLSHRIFSKWFLVAPAAFKSILGGSRLLPIFPQNYKVDWLAGLLTRGFLNDSYTVDAPKRSSD